MNFEVQEHETDSITEGEVNGEGEGNELLINSDDTNVSSFNVNREEDVSEVNRIITGAEPEQAFNDSVPVSRHFGFTIEQLKKIFKKDQALTVLKLFNPELFGKKTQRSRIIKYIGEDEYADIQKIDTNTLIEYVRDFSISNEEGKYKAINDDPEYYKNLIKTTNIKKVDSPCDPQQFSEMVVKREIRDAIKIKSDDIINEAVNACLDKLRKHVMERINQQVKADYTEWLMIKYNQNIIPTLKHTKGTDMFLLTQTGIVELDIKTTRTIWEITDPKEAITKLYEKQGEDRFSSDPRLYIYLSDNYDIDEEKINTQLETTYDITFEYKKHKKTYNVIGARLIII